MRPCRDELLPRRWRVGGLKPRLGQLHTLDIAQARPGWREAGSFFSSSAKQAPPFAPAGSTARHRPTGRHLWLRGQADCSCRFVRPACPAAHLAGRHRGQPHRLIHLTLGPAGNGGQKSRGPFRLSAGSGKRGRDPGVIADRPEFRQRNVEIDPHQHRLPWRSSLRLATEPLRRWCAWRWCWGKDWARGLWPGQAA